MNTVAVLRESRELISDRRRWTKRHDARDKHSHPVPADSPRACRWCVQGAVWRTQGRILTDQSRRAMRALDRAATELDPRAINAAWFNDNHTHAEVLALFERAIEDLGQADG